MGINDPQPDSPPGRNTAPFLHVLVWSGNPMLEQKTLGVTARQTEGSG
jgi:hypothetical protein